MSRKGLVVIAFGLGMIAAPWGVMLLESSVTTLIAQDQGELDLIVIEPVEDELSVERALQPQKLDQDLIVIEPVPDLPAAYLELARLKAMLLTPEALERETELLRRELVELQATQKLKEIESQLQRLIEEHPNTSAAKRAHLMLESIRTPIFPQGRRVPVPDESFESDVYRRPEPKPTTIVPPFDDDIVPARRPPKSQRELRSEPK